MKRRIFLIIGAAVGVIAGAAFDNIGLGIGLALALAVVLGRGRPPPPDASTSP